VRNIVVKLLALIFERQRVFALVHLEQRARLEYILFRACCKRLAECGREAVNFQLD
jgi:hypothetical protein